MTNSAARTVDIPGVMVGHWSNAKGRTGCTAIVLPEGTVASREVRGGAPATRDLDALAPDKAVTTVDGVLLTGGSAFGLGAADGVMRYLEGIGRGVPTPGGRVPIVPTFALFDLAVGSSTARPTADDAYHAAAQASTQFEVGQVGAGTGAYTSHWRGDGHRRPGGVRYAQTALGDLIVGALCVVNGYGDIDPGDRSIGYDAVAALQSPFEYESLRVHTTVGAIVTNARLDKIGCYVVAQGAHDGLARALTPPHTRYDGDGFVAAAVGPVAADVDTVRLLALDAVTKAIRSAVE